MTWALLITLILGTLVKLVTAPPNIVIVWVTERYAMHQKLKLEEATITYNNEKLTDQEKAAFLESYNEASFLVRNHIFKGNEDFFLNPETDVIPYVINVKKGKHDIVYYVYHAEEKVEVVKQQGKKVLAYSLNSKALEERTLPRQVQAI